MLKIEGSLNGGGMVESVDVAGNTLLVTTSNLGGNSWDSSLNVVNLPTEEIQASIRQSCGIADVCWAGREQRIVVAEDSGNLKVYISQVLLFCHFFATKDAGKSNFGEHE